MKTIVINSSEFKTLLIETIQNKNFYLLHQLHEASNSKYKEIVVFETLFELFMYTTYAEIGVRYEAFTDEEILQFGPFSDDKNDSLD